eukprot:CAMPEP_0116998804 /NCGR_PEP_ID=MMETSP0472-20121206/1749_1 /TAXON_ID=693140 ORGANISM="Tiarina fusus, Strain LIS" /NCGR_SAMPLE_ID=MMETSP0472 /ASSEMBLY_ACC=CAM_ASM_000603 /LENGTH=340 /DNA_ID=CAMNT_0004698069 /DNA_START=202 /DNA_END=1224 /DNA_ORIENTATION=-
MAVNKLFIMLPVMFLARKIDGEDPNIVYWLRVAYGTVQTCCLLIVVYTYIQASSAQTALSQKIVYVPAAAVPFADANSKKKFTEVKYGAYILSTSRSLLGSTFFGIVMTVGLHFYKGMIVGLAIQTIMGPFNLIENAVVKAIVVGNGFKEDDKIFEEKTAGELTPDDEIVDENGNPIARQVGAAAGGAASGSMDEILLDTWDAGNKADIGVFMQQINKKNCNFRTKENGWTPLMVLSGLNAKGVASAIRQVKELGGNPAITDVEGWNALHWAAFHGSVDAAKELVKDASLLSVKDKEGKLPLDMAKAEGNDDVALEICIETAATSSKTNTTSDSGLRKRK